MSEPATIGSGSDQNPQQSAPIERARQRALEVARTGADDADVLAVLRAEFAAARLVKKGALRRLVDALRRTGFLEDARRAGQVAVLEALHDTAADEEAPSRTTAAVYLAKRTEADAGAEIKRLLAQLQAMSPAERVAYLEEQLRRVAEAG